MGTTDKSERKYQKETKIEITSAICIKICPLHIKRTHCVNVICHGSPCWGSSAVFLRYPRRLWEVQM